MSKPTNPTTRSRRKPPRRDAMPKGRVVALEDGRQAVQLTLPFDPLLRLDEMPKSLIADIGVSVSRHW
jgi:hypothetical protein